jgi:hypothetical protein
MNFVRVSSCSDRIETSKQGNGELCEPASGLGLPFCASVGDAGVFSFIVDDSGNCLILRRSQNSVSRCRSTPAISSVALINLTLITAQEANFVWPQDWGQRLSYSIYSTLFCTTVALSFSSCDRYLAEAMSLRIDRQNLRLGPESWSKARIYMPICALGGG